MSIQQLIANAQTVALGAAREAEEIRNDLSRLRITTGQIINCSGAVRSSGLNFSLPIPDTNEPHTSPFFYPFDGVKWSYPLTGSDTIYITKMNDFSIRFNLRNQYLLTTTFSNFQNTTLPSIITTNENQNTVLSNLGCLLYTSDAADEGLGLEFGD